MKLYLFGHDYRYAVEQSLLTLFPDQRTPALTMMPSGLRCRCPKMGRSMSPPPPASSTRDGRPPPFPGVR